MSSEITTPALVVLVGPSGAGKTSWANRHFGASSIVSSDALRAVVGLHEGDMKATPDAFAVLETIVTARLSRRLTTVIDTVGLEPERRRRWAGLARRHGLPAYVVAFDTDPAECRRRNKASNRPIPAKALTGQLERFADQRPSLADDFDALVVAGSGIRLVNTAMTGAATAAERQKSDPRQLRFGLQLSSFEFPGRPASTRDALAGIARSAERVGFESLWVMDHFRQIPQVGPEWRDMPESYTTLAYLAGVTERIRLGTLVTAAGYRNPAHLGKIVATLDVLSGGRAMCGLGAGWFEREAQGYGLPHDPAGRRLDRLEDLLRMLPMLWGPGSPSFEGKTFSVPDATCYPRPIQEHIPILVGGGGERRTLRLVAEYADMANLFGDPDVVRHKLAVLARHCDDVGRSLGDLTITHLGPALVGADDGDVARRVADLAGTNQDIDRTAAGLGAGTVDQQIGRLRLLVEAGVETAIVVLPELDRDGAAAVERFAPVISAFR